MKKLIEYLKFIINCKFVFSVKKKKIIVFDCISSYELSKILPDQTLILSSRKEKIKTLFLTKKILFFLITNFFKRKIKLNYFAALLSEINPKVVITTIDNSVEFSKLAKIFEKKINFIAVQNANRADIFKNSNNYNKEFFLPNFFCFSEFDIEMFKRKKINVNKFHTAGSLRNSYFNNFLKEENFNTVYDICFVSKNIWGMNDFTEPAKIILGYLSKFIKDNNKKLVIAAKGYENELEAQMYNQILKENSYEIEWHENLKYNSYRCISRSKVVIGLPSTLLREASINSKVLCCEPYPIRKNTHPFFGINHLCNFSYLEFEKRLNQLFFLDYKDYIKKLNKPKNYYMSSINTFHYIKDYLTKQLER